MPYCMKNTLKAEVSELHFCESDFASDSFHAIHAFTVSVSCLSYANPLTQSIQHNYFF